MDCSNKLLLRSNDPSLERLPTAGGIDPLKAFPLRLKFVRSGNELKSSSSKVPASFASDRSIPETEPSWLQRMPYHRQRRASASVAVEAAVCKWNNRMKRENWNWNDALIAFSGVAMPCLAEGTEINLYEFMK